MLNDLKMLLGIPESDTTLDSKLEYILRSAENRLKLLLGGLEPPELMKYIIVEVALIRFNKIGSEGLTEHSVEGESLTFSANDFESYKDEIQTYLSLQDDTSKGRLRFL